MSIFKSPTPYLLITSILSAIAFSNVSSFAVSYTAGSIPGTPLLSWLITLCVTAMALITTSSWLIHQTRSKQLSIQRSSRGNIKDAQMISTHDMKQSDSDCAETQNLLAHSNQLEANTKKGLGTWPNRLVIGLSAITITVSLYLWTSGLTTLLLDPTQFGTALQFLTNTSVTTITSIVFTIVLIYTIGSIFTNLLKPNTLPNQLNLVADHLNGQTLGNGIASKHSPNRANRSAEEIEKVKATARKKQFWLNEHERNKETKCLSVVEFLDRTYTDPLAVKQCQELIDQIVAADDTTLSTMVAANQVPKGAFSKMIAAYNKKRSAQEQIRESILSKQLQLMSKRRSLYSQSKKKKGTNPGKNFWKFLERVIVYDLTTPGELPEYIKNWVKSDISNILEDNSDDNQRGLNIISNLHTLKLLDSIVYTPEELKIVLSKQQEKQEPFRTKKVKRQQPRAKRTNFHMSQKS